ncbi:putative LF3 [macacine gammaherpesvirus 10]|uniref:LF3 n=1 Tax=macacine gammaherpesvirus 10 TaxID=2560569 RepID=A0A0S0BY56_9GAMA|nr:putative LF3 [macacine gammaherpesvirus 10]ALF03260.1 putative LF3 [macacine gammaherpesvirus 10]
MGLRSRGPPRCLPGTPDQRTQHPPDPGPELQDRAAAPAAAGHPPPERGGGPSTFPPPGPRGGIQLTRHWCNNKVIELTFVVCGTCNPGGGGNLGSGTHGAFTRLDE